MNEPGAGIQDKSQLQAILNPNGSMFKLSIVVRCIALSALICIGWCAAETYQLGSHHVSFNLGEPAKMKTETPVGLPSTGEGWSGLNITPSSGGYGFVKVGETTEVLDLDAVQNLSAMLRAYMTIMGIDGYEDTVISYKGNPALSTYVPAQSKTINGTVYKLTNVGYSLWYTPDENTMVVVEAHTLNNTTYTKLLDSLEVTKIHKPYIGPASAYAGPGKGAKPGLEDQNLISNYSAKDG